MCYGVFTQSVSIAFFNGILVQWIILFIQSISVSSTTTAAK